MASERAAVLPLLLHFDVFREKNIFPLDVIALQGGTGEGGPIEAKGRAVEFPVSWVFLNQPLLLARIIKKPQGTYVTTNIWVSASRFDFQRYMARYARRRGLRVASR